MTAWRSKIPGWFSEGQLVMLTKNPCKYATGLDGQVIDEEGKEEGSKKTNDKSINDDVCEWADDGNDEEEERISLGLLGRLWSERTLNSNAFITTIKNVWVT